MNDKSVQSTYMEMSDTTGNLTPNAYEERCSINQNSDWMNINSSSFQTKSIQVQRNTETSPAKVWGEKENESFSQKSSFMSKNRGKNQALFNMLRTPTEPSQSQFQLLNRNNKIEEPKSSRSFQKKNNSSKNMGGNWRQLNLMKVS